MPRKIDPVDQLVGRNIRVYRMSKGFSQTRLADALGITFQQVQKYEKGVNRIASGRLARISRLLRVPLETFFRGGKSPATDTTSAEADDDVTRLLVVPYALRMLRAFSQIPENTVRVRMVTLAESIAELDAAPAKRSRPLRPAAGTSDLASRRR
jgi:transcriptional regulator with XRE-family HTH domain